ncbi:leucine-rich repeat and coiled-coil domain-containing protein 1 [Pimephales promelas]|uniref:leucine-rich repeat and coiled-coil domain-containing protein 1 n=1 Tax=Pimephales promelas TaxID=90988 RepID=UPI001955E859|nr:leucine-rich repeat and coiled-coil domain-containing protein 1 [Pimephales promelas]XP_039533626.1 leucine-rich repeat and coiled-coil domain-containing protein 1 [Pimephales promelas]KAG1969766.1 leucine-rich repeat and coiled-coil domain-containing protein [Pimephales promelas]KAG1969767.1 leucine-rich repeat and coiled-coil domain-containing protein [Pimephales promelas]
MAVGELCLIDKDISSLLEVHLNPSISSLNLHCNRLTKIEGLMTAWYIRHLDLSSNHICRIEGLSSLSSLRTLNLSCNLISKVEGLNGLTNLTRLNLAYNQINDLTGLLYIHGAEYKLKYLQLHSNRLESMNHLLQCMVGLQNLKDVTLNKDGAQNPICSLPGYREMVLQSLHQVTTLDGVDRLGNTAPLAEDSPMDVPGLEDFLEFLISSDTSVKGELAKSDAPLTTPRIDEVLTQFRKRGGKPTAENQENDQRIKKLEQQVSHLIQKIPTGAGFNTNSSVPSVVHKAKRDTDQTSESECDSGKENQRHFRILSHPRGSAGKKLSKDTKQSESVTNTQKQKSTKLAVGARRRTSVQSSGSVETIESVKNKSIKASPSKSSTQPQEETYRAIVEERDQERERRWKAEQAAKRLTEQVKNLQTQASEEKDLQSLALHTTDRLKELLLKERSDRAGLQTRLQELEERYRSTLQQLEQLRNREDQHKRALHSLKDSMTQAEALQEQQRAEEMKRTQELGNKASALKREVEILRASARQHKEKLQHLHELLASREEMHRKELATRLLPGGTEFKEAVEKEVAATEQRFAQKQADLEQKITDSRRQYAALEDEFRIALTIESKRFSEVKEGFVQVSAELLEVKSSLSQSQQKEKQSASLVQELTAMVKEQKTRITEILKAKKEAAIEFKARMQSLESRLEDDKQLNLQVELLKKDKSKLISQLTTQESVIDGLRAERKIWGQELAQQGASLAQDRGRLEARIEVLFNELESQKKQNERNNDALRIKAKIVDDQTETIRKLKEALLERDEQIRRLRDESVQDQRKLKQQLEEEMASAVELRDTVEQLSFRKEELKQQLLDKEVELDEVKETYRTSSKKWQEKAELLNRLESQVKRMKDGFDSKERTLLEEREKASQAQIAAVEKLHSVDDAFRRQLESLQASHQAELLHLANDKQKQIEKANQKVLQVEEEMRQLLEETESNKRVMEEKMRRLTQVLKDF